MIAFYHEFVLYFGSFQFSMLIVCGGFQEGLEPREIQASVATGETEILLKNAEGKLAPDNNKLHIILNFLASVEVLKFPRID